MHGLRHVRSLALPLLSLLYAFRSPLHSFFGLCHSPLALRSPCQSDDTYMFGKATTTSPSTPTRGISFSRPYDIDTQPVAQRFAPFALLGKGLFPRLTLAPVIRSLSLPHPATASSRVLLRPPMSPPLLIPTHFSLPPSLLRRSSCDQTDPPLAHPSSPFADSPHSFVASVPHLPRRLTRPAPHSPPRLPRPLPPQSTASPSRPRSSARSAPPSASRSAPAPAASSPP